MNNKVLRLIVLAALAFPLFGGPITYTYGGVGSGTLGEQSFTAVQFTFVALADTDNIASWQPYSDLQNSHLSATLAISGIGTFDVITPSHTWVAQGCCAGLGQDRSSNWLTLQNDAIVGIGYGLDTNLGPILETSPDYQVGNVLTSGGALSFSSVDWVTFTASTSSVPEPATFSLFGLGTLGLLLFRARRRMR